ncbi:hypothetical protein [Sulfuracidifex tepidarius]|uniref:hypothetical protein n=1 Tax=Sulfuracidifex tepidarius TaxID=1294262 RepID=UPI0012E2DBBA|nr:hypothetical protein [Sulfuracidifex tepidarius]
MSSLPKAEEDEISLKRSQLRDEITKLKEERVKLVKQFDSLRDRRTELIEKVKQLRTQIETVRGEFKVKLDQLNKLKEKKDSVFKEIQGMRKQLDEAKKSSTQQQPGLRPEVLRRRIKELEWRVETSSLPLDEEKRIIQKIAELEKKLAEVKKTVKVREKGTVSRQNT